MKRQRVQELGLVIGSGTCGPHNSITDVPDVLVGHSTLIRGKGNLVPGKGPIRTGVTAILPHRGNLYEESVIATVHVINGFGKAVGLAQLLELGRLETPILLTSTMNVGLVEDAVTQYVVEHNPMAGISSPTPNPIVAECHDGFLNDAQGRHVRKRHVFASINDASSIVVEGCVGAGTGLTAFGYKSGIGTASRVITMKSGEYTIGCLVTPNFGRRGSLIMGGIPIGHLLEDDDNVTVEANSTHLGGGSIIVILATNAPLSSRQLSRIARRAVIGIGRTGSIISHGSGDFVIAFSNAYREKRSLSDSIIQREQFRDQLLTPFFSAAIEVTEEAVLNGLCMATSMVGRDDNFVEALPLEEVYQQLNVHLKG
jgi:D-aminopeptidase